MAERSNPFVSRNADGRLQALWWVDDGEVTGDAIEDIPEDGEFLGIPASELQEGEYTWDGVYIGIR